MHRNLSSLMLWFRFAKRRDLHFFSPRCLLP